VTFVVLLGGFGRAVHAAPPLSAKAVTEEGKSLVVIANPFLELTFEPARGGRCIRFRFLDNDEQIIDDAPVAGMFLDHWAKYTWPSALMHLPYEHEIVKDGERRIGVRLQTTVPAMGGGKGSPHAASAAKMPTSPDLIGLIVCKTVWLQADSDLIEVDQEVRNPTAESRGVAVYVQHNLRMGGNRWNDNWHLPSTKGIEVNVQPSGEDGKAIGPDWVLDPVAGWMAVVDRESRRGLLFAFDYNYLERIYTCGQTAEWFMETVPVGPGKSFRTNYVIKPLRDFEDVVFGSRHIVADVRPDEKGGEVRVSHDIAAVGKELADVELAVTVTGWKSKKAIAAEKKTFKKLGLTKTRHEFGFTPVDLRDGVVIAVSAKAAGLHERYEYYYAGDKEEHERRYNYFATKGGALAGGRGDAYYRKPPRKVKTFDKPDFAALPRPAPDKFRCLVVFGLYTHILDVDGALAGWKSPGGIAPEFTWANCPPNAVESFPGSYEELFAYNAVVLSDVNYKAVGDIGFEMLCDYVEHGGSLLVTGGPYAFGNGEFEETRFLEVLPVTLSGPFDLKWAGKGKSWPLTAPDPDHPVVRAASLDRAPRVFWHHFVTPREGTEVVLRADAQPALILGRYGKGKVAALTLSPTGEGGQGEVQWWDWNGWPKLMEGVFTWLSE